MSNQNRILFDYANGEKSQNKPEYNTKWKGIQKIEMQQRGCGPIITNKPV